MRYILLILISFSLFSCGDTGTKEDKDLHERPDNLLSREEFTIVYEELYLLEASIRNEVSKGADTKEVTVFLFDQLFKKYQITEKDYLENLNYYARDPIVMQEIQTIVVNKLTKLESTLNNQ